MYFVCNALGYRLMQLAPRGWEMKDTFGAEAISLFLAIGYTLCPQGKDPVRRDEKTKSVKKVSSQPANQPTNPPNQPTSQKNKTVGPRVGSKESTKAQAS
jgi:hypothetical protein